MPAGEHESVSEGVLRLSDVVRKPSECRSTQMHGNVERCVSERPSEVARPPVVAKENQEHRGHESYIIEVLPIVCRYLHRVGGNPPLRLNCSHSRDSEIVQDFFGHLLPGSLLVNGLRGVYCPTHDLSFLQGQLNARIQKGPKTVGIP